MGVLKRGFDARRGAVVLLAGVVVLGVASLLFVRVSGRNDGGAPGLPTAQASAASRTPSSTAEGSTAAGGSGSSELSEVASAIDLTGDVGDCFVLSGSRSDAQRTANKVDCAEPHQLELTGVVDLGNEPRPFPSPEEWASLTDRTCLEHTEARLGGRLDPLGRYVSQTVRLSRQEWEKGERTVRCVIVERALTTSSPNADFVRFAGRAKLNDQAYVEPVGMCGTVADAEHAARRVPCAELHDFENLGQVDLTDRLTVLPAIDDFDGWSHVAGTLCDDVALAYLGRNLRADERGALTPIRDSSFALGQRKTGCVAWRLGPNGRAMATTGSLRDR